MSYDGNGKPGIRGLAQSHESEWDVVCRRPGNKTDRLQRASQPGVSIGEDSHESVHIHWT